MVIIVGRVTTLEKSFQEENKMKKYLAIILQH